YDSIPALPPFPTRRSSDLLRQPRKFFFQKRHKHGSRAWLQKQWISKDVFTTGFRRSASHRVKVAWRVRNLGNHWGTAYPSVDARLIQSPHRLQPQIRTRRTRFKNTREVHIQGRDRDVNRNIILSSNFLQEIEVAQH